ncbi:MAG: hypothetical protein RJB09_2570, partial [Pseudomonadota bacterium]
CGLLVGAVFQSKQKLGDWRAYCDELHMTEFIQSKGCTTGRVKIQRDT